MCDIPPLPGWYGQVIDHPSSDAEWLWLLMPLVLPLLFLLGPPANLRNEWIPPPRLRPNASKLPLLRWYAIQTVLLFIAVCVMEFVALPSDRLWHIWQAQAHHAVRPECQAALETLNSTYLMSRALVAMFGVFLPWLIFLGSAVYVLYARRRMRLS